MSILVYWYVGTLVCENTDSLVRWWVCFLDLIWTWWVVFVGALMLVSVPVLKLVLCIIVLAGVSSGNTSIHMSTDIFVYSWYKYWEQSIRIWAVISGGTLLLIFISILVLIVAFVCILALVPILVSLWIGF